MHRSQKNIQPMTQGVIQDETHLRGGNGREIDDKKKNAFPEKRRDVFIPENSAELYCIDFLRSSISATRLKN